MQLDTSWDAWVHEIWAEAIDGAAPLLAARFHQAYIDENCARDDIDPGLLVEPWPRLAGPHASRHRGAGLIRRYALPGARRSQAGGLGGRGAARPGLRRRHPGPLRRRRTHAQAWSPAEGRHSLQTEIKRSLYMREARCERHAGFDHLVADLGHFVRRLRTVLCGGTGRPPPIP